MAGEENLKNKAITGVAWKFLERIASQGVSTIVSIILARILDPAHYGLIALVNIFTTLCNVFVVTGLGESLIQKKDADDLDFSSIFYVNVVLSLVLYALLFFSAPAIADFYGSGYEQLVPLIRVMGLRLFFAAANSIQTAKISKAINFRKSFFATFVGTAISGIFGISMALGGFGVWALAAHYMVDTMVNTVTLFIVDHWVPKLQFSLKRAIALFSYGWKILASALLNTLYAECRELLIGKVYSPDSLAFYSKGQTYPKLITNNLNTAVASVSFPVFSKILGDSRATKNALSRAIKTASFIVFPAMAGLAMISEPFVTTLLTEKWLPCVPYMRITCLAYAVMTLSTPNLQCLNAQGYSNIYLKITLIKRALGLVLLACVFRIGVLWIALSYLFAVVVEYLIDVIVVKKYIGYTIYEQFKDISLNILTTAIMVVCLYVVGKLLGGLNSLLLMVIQILIGAGVYIALSALFRNDSFFYILNILNKKKRR